MASFRVAFIRGSDVNGRPSINVTLLTTESGANYTIYVFGGSQFARQMIAGTQYQIYNGTTAGDMAPGIAIRYTGEVTYKFLYTLFQTDGTYVNDICLTRTGPEFNIINGAISQVTYTLSDTPAFNLVLQNNYLSETNSNSISVYADWTPMPEAQVLQYGNTIGFEVTAETSYNVVQLGSAKNTYITTIQNTQNMKQVQVGQTIYNNFPVVLNTSSDTIIQASGEDDKTVTVNYTKTKVPVITDT